MPRYVARKVRSDWIDDDRPLLPGLSVPDHEEVFTGLLDHRGDPIYRQPNGVGFGRSID